MHKTILIADDDPAIVDSVTMILENEGYSVIATHKGQAVLELVKKSPHLILLDIWMSGKNGGEICKVLKSHAETNHIPVVLFSANRDGHEIASAAGADTFLQKPFDIDVLLDQIESYI